MAESNPYREIIEMMNVTFADLNRTMDMLEEIDRCNKETEALALEVLGTATKAAAESPKMAA